MVVGVKGSASRIVCIGPEERLTVTSDPQEPRQTKPSCRPCISVSTRMLIVDVVRAINADLERKRTRLRQYTARRVDERKKEMLTASVANVQGG